MRSGKGKLLSTEELEKLANKDFSESTLKTINNAKRDFVKKIQEDLKQYVEDYERTRSSLEESKKSSLKDDIFDISSQFESLTQKELDSYSLQQESGQYTNTTLEHDTISASGNEPSLQKTVDGYDDIESNSEKLSKTHSQTKSSGIEKSSTLVKTSTVDKISSDNMHYNSTEDSESMDSPVFSATGDQQPVENEEFSNTDDAGLNDDSTSETVSILDLI